MYTVFNWAVIYLIIKYTVVIYQLLFHIKRQFRSQQSQGYIHNYETKLRNKLRQPFQLLGPEYMGIKLYKRL